MKQSDDVRSDVAKAYERAVTRPATSSCCCCGPVQKGAVVGAAGYRPEELATLPADVTANSQYCTGTNSSSTWKPP